MDIIYLQMIHFLLPVIPLQSLSILAEVFSKQEDLTHKAFPNAIKFS